MSSDDLNDQIEELAARLKEAAEFYAPLADEQNALLTQKMIMQQQFDEQISAMNKKILESSQKAAKMKQTMSQAEWELKQLKAKQEAIKAAEEEKRRQELLAIEEEKARASLYTNFDKLTIGAKWREWAKDHQINGAKKIVEDRYVILGDPMGLGKTLTSIITVEMAERVTKTASEEFPFLGEEVEEWISDTWVHNSTKQKYKYKTQDIINNPEEYTFTEGHKSKKIINSITRPVGRRVLYLCPNALVKNVKAEWNMWAPHRNVIYLANMTRDERKFALNTMLPQFNDFVVILNYEAWRRDWALIERLTEFKFDTIIIDEAHAAKDHKSIVWKGINELVAGRRHNTPATKNTHRPEYIIPMTGTPVLNRPQELFTLLNLVDPRNFYYENDFLYEFCEQNDEGFWKFMPGGMDRLSKKLSKVFMRRTKDQAGIILPEKTIIEHLLDVDEELYPEQSRARKEMKQFATIKLKEKDEFGQPKALSAAAIIAMYTRLRQIETWPAGIVQKDKNGEIIMQLDVHESQKIDYIINPSGMDGLITEISEDERIVLFSQFKAPLSEIKSRCEKAGLKAVILDGDTPSHIKDEIRLDFDRRHTPDRTKAKWDIVLCNYKVGGVGLNLTAATQMIILDDEWNPGKRDQAYDRIHRIGQEEAVTIHEIRMAKTIDDWLANIMSNKQNLVDGFNQVTGSEGLKEFLEGGFI